MSEYFRKPIVKTLMLKGEKGDTGDSDYQPAVDALGKRIDNLILSSGTDSSAEVIDARTGYDGTSYNTLGTAIRTQIKSVVDQQEILGLLADGYYKNDAHIEKEGDIDLTRLYVIPKGCENVHIKYMSTRFYNKVTLLDENKDIISYIGPNNETTEYEADIKTNGAKYIALCGQTQNLAGAIITYKTSKKTEYEVIADLIPCYGFYSRKKKVTNNYIGMYMIDAYDIDYVLVSGTFAPNYNIVTFVDENDNTIGYVKNTVEYIIDIKKFKVPFGTKKIFISNNQSYFNTIKITTSSYDKDYDSNKNTLYLANGYWHDKKIVWLGTSIPAGGKYGYGNDFSYPMIVGKKLGITVYNEAVGSSPIHCKDKSKITSDNPYGFRGSFESCSRCLTNTIDEMNWIIEHYNSGIFSNAPSELTDEDKEFIRSCSYENKIDKYLTSSTVPNLFVLDHGHNDGISDEQENVYNKIEKPLSYTEKKGYYMDGKLFSANWTGIREFDVSSITGEILIKGNFRVNYDVYNIFDADGQNIGHKNNKNSDSEFIEYVDVTNASKLIVSNNDQHIYFSTVAVGIPFANQYENLYCYQGAMDFIINHIKKFDPRIEVVMIGEYENQLRPKIAEYQTKISENWSIPLFKAWEVYGWSQHTVETTGYWNNNGYWVDNGGTLRKIPYLYLWLRDKVHPHSDKSGKALNYMADYISAWISNLKK